jgi:hypothetical protein
VSSRFDYAALLNAATVGVVRQVLADAAEHGLEGDHHFFLTFRTGDAGVRVPPSLARTYPEVMTVVLQHQFVGLEVDDEAFAVTLRFGGTWERVRVPFAALTTFLDPSVPFGLDFTQFAGAAANGAGVAFPMAGRPAGGEAPKSGPVEPPAPEQDVDESSPGNRSQAGSSGAQDPGPVTGPASGDLLPFRRR